MTQQGRAAANRWFLVVCGALACVAAGCAKGAKHPNILLLTIDTLRADRLGSYGFALSRTPYLDGIAEGGIRATNAMTVAPITLPAHTSIMTGLYPPTHGVRDNGAYAVSDSVITLAERLRDAGYATQAFVSAVVLARIYNLTQGFDGYDDDLWAEDVPALFMIRDRPAARTAPRVVAWLEQWAAERRQPFFVWTHFFDPHQPWEASGTDRYLSPTAYDAEIAATDRGVGMIIDTLTRLGLLDDTIVVVTADHGESLGEHGEKTHGVFIYRSTIHVPYLLRYPRLLPAGRVYKGPVSAVDTVPTLLAMLGLPGGEQTEGTNLLPAFRGEAAPPDRPQYSESLLADAGFGMAPLFGLRRGGHTWIRAPRPELYDTNRDPAELDNLYDGRRTAADRLDSELTALLEQSREDAVESEASPVSPETEEALRSLGYIASFEQRKEVSTIDPKDGIVLREKLEEARHLAQRRRWNEAESLVREISRETPNNVTALNMLGFLAYERGDMDAAAGRYRKSLEVDPRQFRSHFMLGQTEFRLGRLKEAEDSFRRALEITPGFVEAMGYLGFLAEERGNAVEAQGWYERARGLEPRYTHVFAPIADYYYLRNDFARARVLYERTLQAIPEHFQARVQAANAAMELGDYEAASSHLQHAQTLRPAAWIPPFNLALVRSLEGRDDDVFALLRTAVERGLADASVFADAKELKRLRDEPRYREIVHEAAAQASARRNSSQLSERSPPVNTGESAR